MKKDKKPAKPVKKSATKTAPSSSGSARSQSPKESGSSRSSAPSSSSSRVSAERRQELFESAYLANGMNATQAAIAAGYSPKTAASQASRLLRNVKVAEAVGAKAEQALQRLDYSVDRVLNEVARIAFLDLADIFNEDGSLKPVRDMSPDARAAISSLELDEQHYDSLDAVEVEDGALVLRPGKVITKKVKLSDKKAALDMLMRFHSLYKDKVTVEVDLADAIAKARARARNKLKG